MLILVIVTDASLMKLPSDECKWILLMISQCWFRLWLGAIRQLAITGANVDSDLCRHMASLGHNELMYISKRGLCVMQIITHNYIVILSSVMQVIVCLLSIMMFVTDQV